MEGTGGSWDMAGCWFTVWLHTWESQSAGRQAPEPELRGGHARSCKLALLEVGFESASATGMAGDMWNSVLCEARGQAMLPSGWVGTALF